MDKELRRMSNVFGTFEQYLADLEAVPLTFRRLTTSSYAPRPFDYVEVVRRGHGVFVDGRRYR